MSRIAWPGVLCALVLAIGSNGCNKAAATVEYDLQYRDVDFPDVHVSEQAMGSGVVSGTGYNQGVYVVSYHRLVLPTGEARDVFLTFDVPAAADGVTIRNRLITEGAYVMYEELTADGELLLVSEKPSKAEFCVKELFMNDEGEPGGVIFFEIELPTRGIVNGVFRTEDSAEKVAESASKVEEESGTRTMQWAEANCQ